MIDHKAQFEGIEDSSDGLEASDGQGTDWTMLLRLSREVLSTACLAVLAHGEEERLVENAGQTIEGA